MGEIFLLVWCLEELLIYGRYWLNNKFDLIIMSIEKKNLLTLMDPRPSKNQ